jgi:hypothetical protein
MQTFFENHQLIHFFIVILSIIILPYFFVLSTITIIFTITNIIDGIYWICGYNKVELPSGTFQRYPRYIYLTNNELKIYKKQKLEEEERKKRTPPPPPRNLNATISKKIIITDIYNIKGE